MDIEVVMDPYACMMYIVSPLAGLGGAYCGGRPPTACYISGALLVNTTLADVMKCCLGADIPT